VNDTTTGSTVNYIGQDDDGEVKNIIDTTY